MVRKRTPDALELGEPVLFWQGGVDPHAPGERFIVGIPAADITEGMLQRLTYVRTIDRPLPEGTPRVGLRPGDEGYTEARQEIVDVLIFSGLYSTKPKEGQPADQPGATEQPKE